jgi:hypothetical protein
MGLAIEPEEPYHCVSNGVALTRSESLPNPEDCQLAEIRSDVYVSDAGES